MPRGNPTRPLTIRYDKETIQIIDEFSREFGGLPRPATIRHMVRILKVLKDRGVLEKASLSLLALNGENCT